MKNCKAAQYNPANACTDRCKWPGACTNGQLSIASVMETTEVYMAVEVDPVEEAAPTTDAEPPKKKPGRPKKVQ